MSDVRLCPSTSCLRKPLPTRRRRADQVSWSTRDHRPWKAVKSRLSSRHNSYTISSMNIPSSPKRTMRTCRVRYRLLSHRTLFSVSPPIPQLSEAEFWKRYFQSKLFHSHRASIRSTATQHVVKDDAIFDKYLEKPDDGEPPLFSRRGSCQHNILELEPRKLRDDEVDMFIDLEATRGDHEEVRNLTFHGLSQTCVNFTIIL